MFEYIRWNSFKIILNERDLHDWIKRGCLFPLSERIFQAKRKVICTDRTEFSEQRIVAKQFEFRSTRPELIRINPINLNEARVTVRDGRRPFFWETRRLFGSRDYAAAKREIIGRVVVASADDFRGSKLYSSPPPPIVKAPPIIKVV